MQPEEVLAQLDPEQRAAAQVTRGPVCILAGAGTGKTRTITHRIAYAVLTGSVPASQLLAVTFTARAAGELRGRLRTLGVAGVQARTFHAAALRQLSYFWPRVVGGPMPGVLEVKIRAVAAAAARCRLPTDRALLRDIATEIEWAKAALVGPAAYPAAAAAAGREPPLPRPEVARVYAAYEEVKQRDGVVDFDDLLLLTAAAIEEHADVADELRARYRHFVVDEYQDVSPLQHRLLDAWLGGRDDLCVVGDANQTIYSFTGASPRYLAEFGRRFPTATVVRLVRDYRSTPQVVALANRVIAGSVPATAGPDTGSADTRLTLLAQRPPGPPPTFTEYADEPAEAADVARRCRDLVTAGTPAHEIAVLYRVNAQSVAFEQALAAAGLPYLVRGGERFFQRPEVREAVMLLRAAARSADADAPTGLVAGVTDVLSAAGWSPSQPPPGPGATRERWESLAALARLAGDLAATDAAAGLPAFVDELEERAAAQHAPTVDGVTLASLHAAKGLEWDAVFLIGLVDGTLPIVHATTTEHIEEERRLFYVGATRAREHLALSWALARGAGGRRGRRPSRFLDGLRPADPRADGARGGRSSARGGRTRAGDAGRGGPVPCRVCGRALLASVERKLRRCQTCPADLDEELFERLRAWRSGKAKEQGQPAFCVFTDATLTAIAEERPATIAALVEIPGIGQRKLDSYGDDVLALVTAAAVPGGAG